MKIYKTVLIISCLFQSAFGLEFCLTAEYSISFQALNQVYTKAVQQGIKQTEHLTSKERAREEKELDKQKAKSDSAVYAATFDIFVIDRSCSRNCLLVSFRLQWLSILGKDSICCRIDCNLALDVLMAITKI
jgi:hypothetical protein